jgi:hypothetical protein
MAETVTVTLTMAERDELVRALVLLEEHQPSATELLTSIRKTLAKLAIATEGPCITIGVHGGQVQWVLGNPFLIRICDYDGEDDELPDIDERHQKCRIWFEPVDTNWQVEHWAERPKRS